jgi:hypothetical protein
MDAFFQDQGFAILAALIIFILTLVLGALLRPAFEAAGQRLFAWLRGLTSDFERRYQAHLLDEYRVMNVRGRKTKAPVSLDLEQVYVSLQTQLPDASAIARGGRGEALDLKQALQRSRRLAIIGGPGSGKTTLLHYLLLTYARGLTAQRLGLNESLLPIFVPLRQLKTVLSRSGKRNLPDYLSDYYSQLGLAPPAGFFESQLKHGRGLVLLDGLDEVADQTERLQLAEWVDAQVTIFPDNRFIVTSRPAGYDTAALENGFLRLDVQDFSQADIEQFCRNWCLAVEVASRGQDTEAARRKAADAAHDLIQAIAKNKAVRLLAVNPLLLSIIALVHRYRATLPRRRVELYAECVDVLLGKWDEAKGLAGRLTESQKRAVLQPIALQMHQDNTRELDGQTLTTQLKQHLPTVGGQPEEAQQFLTEVRDRSGLLLEQELNRYTFSHLTFQEYLVARELADNGPEQTLLDHAGEEWWQEVTLLYTGLKDATPVVQALLRVEESDGYRPLLLAGRSLLDAQKIDPPVKTATLNRLQALFDQGSGQSFLEAGLVLADLENEQALERFLRVVGGENEARRNAAWWALEQLLNSKNEVQREAYRRQLVQLVFAPASNEFSASAMRVLAELAVKEPQVAELIIPKLAPIVTNKQTWISQAIVGLLNDKNLATIAADWLDHLMAEVPGKKIYIARYPVTNAQYRRFIDQDGYNVQQWWGKDGRQWKEGQKANQPRYWQDQKWNRPDCPVVGVTWYEAEAYCTWLSEHTGRTYRLPTEAEWQPAAQGNDRREYPWGNDWQEGRCNTSEARIGRTSPVGQFSPAGDSPCGCADMSGNVWEWCADWYDKEHMFRVLRGGSWYLSRDGARCAYRYRFNPDYSNTDIGFRVVSPIS